jgi:hypothetical protein
MKPMHLAGITTLIVLLYQNFGNILAGTQADIIKSLIDNGPLALGIGVVAGTALWLSRSVKAKPVPTYAPKYGDEQIQEPGLRRKY